MATYSQAVIQQKNKAEEITRAFNTHKSRIFTKMAELFKPHMSEEQYNSFLHDAPYFFDLQLAYLDDLTSTMASVDLEHAKETLETSQARAKRDVVLNDTWSQLNSLKQAISGFHGETSLSLLGMNNPIPRTPIELQRYLENIENVVNQGVLMPDQVLPGPVVWTNDAILKVIRPMLGQLRDALAVVSQEQQEDKDTMTRKWELMEKQNHVYTAVAHIAEAYARIAGEHELGERLRPRANGRPGRRANQENGGSDVEAPQPVVAPVVTEPTPTNPVG